MEWNGIKQKLAHVKLFDITKGVYRCNTVNDDASSFMLPDADVCRDKSS